MVSTDRKFWALGDETRLKIVRFLLDGEKCVCKIVPHIGRTQSTVSIQLGKLEDAEIVKSRRDGKRIYYRIADKKISKVIKMMDNE